MPDVARIGSERYENAWLGDRGPKWAAAIVGHDADDIVSDVVDPDPGADRVPILKELARRAFR